MEKPDTDQPARFAQRVVGNFQHAKYELVAESYETTWGFRSTSGKYFKISNRDLAKALADIVANWNEWSYQSLNINSDNPDSTLAEFSKQYFSGGAHKDLAEVQRRGFLHLINSVAYASRHNAEYDEAAWDSPLKKADYEEALKIVREYSDDAEKMSGAGSAPPTSPTSERETGGQNVLFYGAPGTGKSHDVWEKIKLENGKAFLTVFHPDMQNSDFTGTLKPGTDAKGAVSYLFRPGPFARAVKHAWANPMQKTFLVIEELNRAVAAAVFGELFQLLDREPNGASRYEVDFPSPEFEQWFVTETGLAEERLSLPSNLWILATMNSADQGVYPLDTAFRRRWKQRYLPLDYRKAPPLDVKYQSPKGAVSTNWRIFVEKLNEFLVSRIDIGEDRLIGPRFLDDNDLENGKLPGKLLIYLWDDLLRHHGRHELFAPEIKTYGDLDRRLRNSAVIFSEAFFDAFESPENGSEADADSDGT